MLFATLLVGWALVDSTLGGDVITVDYAALTGLQGRMRELYAEIEQALASLATDIDNLRTTWEGAASDGFHDTVRAWQAAVADLHQRLAELHNFVGTAHDNQATAVRSNTSIWTRRRA
jgi:WXG100 family type VII secretion target